MTGRAGVVLAGGRSSRMGRPKALLPWRGRTLVEAVVDVLATTCDRVVVVRAPGQDLPALPGVAVVDDPVEGLGPLQGLATGLSAAGSGSGPAFRAFVCSTDLPFLVPAYVEAVLGLLTESDDVVLPVLHGHRQPLAAAYRPELAAEATRLLAEGARRPGQLHAVARTRCVGEADLLADPALAAADPALRSVLGVNTPEEWAAARCSP